MSIVVRALPSSTSKSSRRVARALGSFATARLAKLTAQIARSLALVADGVGSGDITVPWTRDSNWRRPEWHEFSPHPVTLESVFCSPPSTESLLNFPSSSSSSSSPSSSAPPVADTAAPPPIETALGVVETVVATKRGGTKRLRGTAIADGSDKEGDESSAKKSNATGLRRGTSEMAPIPPADPDGGAP
jgi:hypothetical protein